MTTATTLTARTGDDVPAQKNMRVLSEGSGGTGPYRAVVTLWDTAGNPIESGNPLPVQIIGGVTVTQPVQVTVLNDVGIDDATPVRVEVVSGSLSVSVSPQASELHLGQVGGEAAAPTATFTRPADTTAYASGDLVANNTTAGSVTPLSLTVARVAAGSFLLRRVRLRKSGTSVTNATFRVHFYSASPSVTNGDNGAWLSSGSADYIGSMDVSTMKAFSDGAVGVGQPNEGYELTHKLASGQIVYALVEARAAYTPASAEVFLLTVEDLQN